MPVFRKTILLVFGFFFLSGSCVFAQTVADAVVKIFVTSNSMDYYQPWQSHGMKTGSGSGCIIKGNKILTNAHVVADHTFIQVKKNNDSKKYTARVETIGYDCDLALLTVDDPEFFKDTTQLTLGTLPNLQDSVTVLGFPQGGDKLSITEGVVSRIEVTAYSQSTRKLLTVQIDAAINPGNSGGAVLQGDKLVGIAMQVFQSGQNIGYIIPVPIINHFIEDLQKGTYDGFPMFGIDYATTENKTLRKFYKIDKMNGGILVSRVMPFSSAEGILQEGDVILNVDGIDIGEDGTYEFRKGERLAMPHLLTQHQIGDQVKIKLIRDGKSMAVDLKLTSFAPLVANPNSLEKPPYYIFGGLVFTVLSSDLLREWGQEWWNDSPLDFQYYVLGTGRLNKDSKNEVVVLLNVLSDDLNIGYHQFGNDIVEKVNGQKIESFREFVRLLEENKNKEPYTIIDFESLSRVILDNKGIDTINNEIIKRNNIPQAYSEDVKQWLEPVIETKE